MKHQLQYMAATCAFVMGAGAVEARSVIAAGRDALTRYVTDDVAGVAYLDIASIDLPAVVNEARGFGVPEEVIRDAAGQAARVQGVCDQLKQLGAGRFYVLLRPADLVDRGFAAVIEVTEEGRPQELAGLLAGLFGANRDVQPTGDVWFVPRRIEVHDGSVLLAMNDAQMERLRSRGDAGARAEAAESMAALGDGQAGVAVFGDDDSRRVIREMLPALPAPFQEVDGQLIADGLRWGGLKIDQPPQLKATLLVEAARDDVAQTIQQAAIKGLELGKAAALASLVRESHQPPVDALRLAQGLALLKPEVDGARLTLTLGDDEQELTFVRDLLAPSIVAARASAYRRQRMNQFKQIALAMLNYENSSGQTQQTRHLPAHASYDDQGRALLSWRVHVLPFLDQRDLYNQFRLDEPWDSQHNLPLVEKMPEIWADPDPIIRRQAGLGRTTYVVPYGKETGYFGSDGINFRDINDGTSNTIACVEVVPQRAVVWTKPEDWEVNLDNPLAGVLRTDREYFTATMFDGSVHTLPNDISPETLRALLTIDGGDSIEPWR